MIHPLRVRRTWVWVVGAALFVATPLLGGPSALAEPVQPPNCTAADLANVTSGVAGSTSAYLFGHPDVNEFFTGLHGQSQADVPQAVRAYFDSNPQAHTDLKNIRQPLNDFRARCGEAEDLPGQ